MSSSSHSERTSLADALSSGLTALSQAGTTNELRAVMTTLTGKKGAVASVKSQLGRVSDIEERKALGILVNEAIAALESAAEKKF
jgi:phenylalanyl-tRNA synthetase alpha subunit